MALTAAERKANQVARKQNAFDSLVSTNALLTEDNNNLRLEINALKTKLHKMEINSLKAQIKAKG